MKSRILVVLAAGAVLAVAPTATAAMRITEWMYSGNPGEFVELTNIGGAPIDMNGWSYSDEDDEPGTVSLSAFGIVNPGESVIFTEASAATFKTAWNIPMVKVIGGVTDNLSRTDAIYIYDNSDATIDVLDFGDESSPGAGPRTQNRSGNPLTLAAVGANDVSQWVLSSVADAYGSYNSTSSTTGNPGKFALIPEPSSLELAAMGVALLARRRRS